MIKIKNIVLICSMILFSSCVNYKIEKSESRIEKKFYSSRGFALIYEEGLIKTIMNIEKDYVMHSFLKKNTPIKIINPENSKSFETKISKTASYPKIFNIVITQKVAEILELDINNPYLEVFEIKKNEKFVAKEGSMFEEEKNVAEKVPVDDIQMDDLGNKKIIKVKKEIKSNFVLVVSDFYYLETASNLKKRLAKDTQLNNFYIFFHQ